MATSSIATLPAAILLTAAALGADPPGVALPPDAEGALRALQDSPRHGEWVDVPLAGGAPVRTWVVHPERADRAPVVLVIHEIFGLTDWVRAVADQLAAEGFVAAAPDLLSGMGPGGGGTESFQGDSVREAIRKLTPGEVAHRLDAVRAHVLSLPSARPASASIGFCWGGSASFGYATAQPALGAAVVYYGTAPTDPAALAKVACPVLGLYGGDDARVTSTVTATKAAMDELGKPYSARVYDNAGHGFLRQQSGRDGANRNAAARAWSETVSFLKERLEKR